MRNVPRRRGIIYYSEYLCAQKSSYGSVSGLFLIGYGAFRIIVEFFRQPDAQLGLFSGISMGQILSIPMIILGIIFMVWAYRRDKPPTRRQQHTNYY